MVGRGGKPAQETPWWRVLSFNQEHEAALTLDEYEWRVVALRKGSIMLTLLRLLLGLPMAWNGSNAQGRLFLTSLLMGGAVVVAFLTLRVRKDPQSIKYFCYFIYCASTFRIIVQAAVLPQDTAEAMRIMALPQLTFVCSILFKIPPRLVLAANVFVSMPDIYDGNMAVVMHTVLSTIFCVIILQVDRACFLDRYAHGHRHLTPEQQPSMLLVFLTPRDHRVFLRWIQRGQFVGLCVVIPASLIQGFLGFWSQGSICAALTLCLCLVSFGVLVACRWQIMCSAVLAHRFACIFFVFGACIRTAQDKFAFASLAKDLPTYEHHSSLLTDAAMANIQSYAGSLLLFVPFPIVAACCIMSIAPQLYLLTGHLSPEVHTLAQSMVMWKLLPIPWVWVLGSLLASKIFRNKDVPQPSEVSALLQGKSSILSSRLILGAVCVGIVSINSYVLFLTAPKKNPGVKLLLAPEAVYYDNPGVTLLRQL